MVNRRRTGLTLIRNLAGRMCRVITQWTPVITLVFSTSPALLLALEAVNTACAALVLEADAVLETNP